jgi:hypothetical protein
VRVRNTSRNRPKGSQRRDRMQRVAPRTAWIKGFAPARLQVSSNAIEISGKKSYSADEINLDFSTDYCFKT